MMLYAGIDLGTTTISAVVVQQETAMTLKTITHTHNSFILSSRPWEKCQNVALIEDTVRHILEEILQEYPAVAGIGLTGQMHGIVYVDQQGRPVSDLMTWQDQRANLQEENGSLIQRLQEHTDSPIATGYGLVTHVWNLQHGCVPPDACGFTTLSNYIGMRLCGKAQPIIHKTDAAGLGFFNVVQNCYETDVLHTLGVEESFLPRLHQQAEVLGQFKGIPVVIGIGDNQASYLGTVEQVENSMLINIGTGAQLSVYTRQYVSCPGCEPRPFVDEGYMLVGSSLCGGRAFSLLENFFRGCVRMAGFEAAGSIFPAMDEVASKCNALQNVPTFTTSFCGSRTNTAQCASITGLTVENFTPQHLILAALHGMVDEMYAFYETMLPGLPEAPTKLFGAGNMVRLTPGLPQMIELAFNKTLVIPPVAEEAGRGAAVFAASALK